ncbi:MAG: sugar ABC transporter ATP-binding protein [Spirochaetaceae bacterium]
MSSSKKSSLLRIEGVSKRFPGVQALSGVTFDVAAGEIHGLIGENGAGKSTLIKVISGAEQRDAGHFAFNDAEYNPKDPNDALKQGIAVVHQELSLCENLSVAENIFVNRQPSRTPLRVIDRRRLKEETRALLGEFELELSPDATVAELSLAVREQVEILRALAYCPRLLILDEPTAPLSKPLAQRLFELLRSLRDQGVSIIYISHNISEVLEICDRVTVLRDGQVVDTVAVESVRETHLARMMVGRNLEDMFPPRASEGTGRVLLRASNFAVPGVFEDVNLEVREGEILGFAGLVGAGRTEVALALFGAYKGIQGVVEVDGEIVREGTTRNAIRSGIAYVSEDRKALGLYLNFSIAENLLVTNLRRMTRLGLVDNQALEVLASDCIASLEIRAPDAGTIVNSLSGGNQQKVMLAKWLSIKPKILIVDEPTRGIDIGAKQAIHALLRRMADDGMGVIMISSELPEVLGMSDRILLMDRGQVVTTVENGPKVTEEFIMESIVAFRKTGGNRE